MQILKSWCLSFFVFLMFGSTPAQASANSYLHDWSVGFYVDPENQLTISDIKELAADKFVDLKNSPLRLGFTSSTVWLRVTVHDSFKINNEYWLELTSPLLEDVTFFSNQSGIWHPTPKRIISRKPVFKIHATQNITDVYYIKINSRTSITTEINLWDPDIYAERESRSTMNWSLMYGAYMTMVILFLGFWYWSREKIHLIYFLYIGVNFSAAFMSEGWALQAFKSTTESYIDTLGILISLSILTGTSFTATYLEFKNKLPKLNAALMLIATAISTFCITTILNGDYQTAIITAQISSIPLIFINLLIAVYLLSKGSMRSTIFIIAFTPFYAGVVWRYMRNINLIESNFFNDNAYQFGAFFHMILMSFGIFSGYTRLRNERNQAQLKAQAEKSLREQQTNFMNMISHETRTPLSVIMASAENALLDPSLSEKTQTRLNKINKAADRIKNLLTQFISRERELTAPKAPNLKLENLIFIIEKQLQESQLLHEVFINFNPPKNEIFLYFDAELIRIAFANLIENAIQHSQGKNDVDVGIQLQNGEAVIRVSDCGPGFTEQELPHALSRYYRGKNSNGFGLGLYLANQIALEHGGRLSIINRPGEGCDVMLCLPMNRRDISDKSYVT